MRINRSIIETVVQAGLTAPSGDNCQPFSFEWDEQRLQVRHHEDRGRHFLNVNNGASLIAFGMLLELMTLKASEFSLGVEVTFTPHLGSPVSQIWAVVTFHESTEIKKHPLVSSIDQRFADRHSYKGGQLSASEQAVLETTALTLPHIHWKIIHPPMDSFIPLLKKSEDFIWRHVAVDPEFFRWFIFNKAESLARCEGMYWKELGIRWPETLPLRLMRKWPFLANWFWYLGLKASTEKLAVSHLKTSAGLIGFSTSLPNATSLVQVGQQSVRLWLQLNALGYSVQPMTQCSLLYYYLSQNGWGPEIRSDYLQQLKNSLPAIQSFFGWSSQQIPVWCLRFGRPSGQQTTRLSLRRPTSAVLSFTNPAA